MHGKKIVTYYYEIGTQIYLSFSAFDMLFYCKLIVLSISAPFTQNVQNPIKFKVKVLRPLQHTTSIL
jgi:hypothetical protein